MSNNSKTYIVNDQATETDALDFMPYVETLADIIQTGNTPLTIGVFVLKLNIFLEAHSRLFFSNLIL